MESADQTILVQWCNVHGICWEREVCRSRMLSMGGRLGTSSHTTKEKHVVMSFQEFHEPENVAMGEGRVVKAFRSGSVRMNMLFQATCFE